MTEEQPHSHVDVGAIVQRVTERDDKMMSLIVAQSEKARKDNIKVIVVCIGIFTAIAGLITALAAWLSTQN
jgi:hypothetical protein